MSLVSSGSGGRLGGAAGSSRSHSQVRAEVRNFFGRDGVSNQAVALLKVLHIDVCTMAARYGTISYRLSSHVGFGEWCWFVCLFFVC